jgi:predicted lipid carrier protein YhbT
MYPEIIVVPSALKHGVHEADLRWAFKRPHYDGPIERAENKFIRLGFDPHGNLLEMLYTEIDDHAVKIFHAMKCRSIFFHLLNP